MLKISVKLANRVLDNYTLEKPVVAIGRDPSCDVCVDNPLLSRRHAQITHADGKYWLEDLNSTNGVFLKGNKITKGELHDGDEFRIDKFTFLVHVAEGAPQPKKEFAFDIMGTMQIDASALKEKLKADQAAAAHVPSAHPAAPMHTAVHPQAATSAPGGSKVWIALAAGLAIGFAAGFLAAKMM